MRFRLYAKPEPLTYEDALSRMKQCFNDIERYLEAFRVSDHVTYLPIRHAITLYVAPGVYRFESDGEKRLFAAFGPTCHVTASDAERAFSISYVPLDILHGIQAETWYRDPLIGSTGFLMPVTKDGYRGPRFTRVGDIIHP
jgi:hypothetical protein